MARALTGETRAYGFALVVWTTAALTQAERGSPERLGAVAYVGGALAAMALVILATFGGVTEVVPTKARRRQRAIGAVHLASVGIAIAAGWAVAVAIPTKWAAYAASAFTAVLLHQLVLGWEVATSEQASGDQTADRDPRVGQPHTNR